MFFKKEPVNIDNTDRLYISDTIKLPLTCDEGIYRSSIALIRGYISNWIEREITSAVKLNIGIEHTLVYSLVKTDTKYLGYPTPREIILSTLIDNEVSQSGSRFYDMITNICIEIPPLVMEVMRGRFMYAVLYNNIVSCKPNDPYPTKELWADTLKQIPWVALIPIIQEIYEETKVADRYPQFIENNIAPD